MRSLTLLRLVLVVGVLLGSSARGQELRVFFPPSAKGVVVEAAREMKADQGQEFKLSLVASSGEALKALGEGRADVAVITRALKGTDRALYPEAILTEIPVGMEVVALGVSNDVWEGSIRHIDKATMRKIYEQKVKNWNEVEGPDAKIKQYTLPEGNGTWEIFAEWLYGDNRKAPLPKGEKVESNEDAQSALEFAQGGIAPMSPLAADGKRCHALWIEGADGNIYPPTVENVANGSYTLTRPLEVVVNGRPTLAIRGFVEFLTGPSGQAIVEKEGLFGLNAVPKKSADPYQP